MSITKKSRHSGKRWTDAQKQQLRLLRYTVGMSFESIAIELGRSIASVRSQLRRLDKLDNQAPPRVSDDPVPPPKRPTLISPKEVYGTPTRMFATWATGATFVLLIAILVFLLTL